MNAPFIKEPVKTALSKQQDAKLAAQELADQLMGPDLGFVLFFCSAEYDLETLSRELHLAFDGVELAGCTTAGEVTPRGYDRGSITAVGFDQNLFSIDVALIESLEGFSLNDAQNLVSGLVTQSRSRQVAPIKGHSFALTLLDGLSSQQEEDQGRREDSVLTETRFCILGIRRRIGHFVVLSVLKHHWLAS